MSSFYRTRSQRRYTSRSGRGTYLVIQRADAPRADRAKVARDDALHPDFLRGADDVALRAQCPDNDDADENVRAFEGLLEALDAVVQVSRADLDAPRTQVGDCGL